MTKARLFPASGRAFLAVSGGADSMALLHLMVGLKEKYPQLLQELVVLHVHHGNRSEQDLELIEVLSEVKNLRLAYRVRHLGLDDGPNFEARARAGRKEIFLEQVETGDLVYTGHHIDDSFEWSLMQSFKSGSVIPSLGIPVINGAIARPLHAFGRSQLRYFCERFQISFLEDPSNTELRFERNRLRSSLKFLANDYPQALKHYVARANQLALELGRSIS